MKRNYNSKHVTDTGIPTFQTETSLIKAYTGLYSQYIYIFRHSFVVLPNVFLFLEKGG